MANKLGPAILKKSAHFAYIKTNGKTISAIPWLLSNYCDNKDLGLRVGWTIPTYVGNAVVRNRFKRWLREYLKKLHGDILTSSIDINLVFRRKNSEFYDQLEHEVFDDALATLFKKMERLATRAAAKDSKVYN